MQSGIQQALAHALATSAGVPSSETGLVRNVLNHISVTTYTGVSTSFKVEDLRRLCWIWEWDGKTLPKPSKSEEEDNPFLDDGVVQTTHPKEWSRGGMDMVLSPTSHYSKASGKREPAYGIGIEVELDLNRDLAGGTAAVARWAAGAESRLKDFRNKLNSWVTVSATMRHILHRRFLTLHCSCMPMRLLSREYLWRICLHSLVPPSPPLSPLPWRMHHRTHDHPHPQN